MPTENIGKNVETNHNQINTITGTKMDSPLITRAIQLENKYTYNKMVDMHIEISRGNL